MEASTTQALFEAVVKRDHDALATLYATNASSAIMSFLSMRSRWTTSGVTQAHRDEEKMDEFLQQLADRESEVCQKSAQKFSREDIQSYYTLLRELAMFLNEKNEESEDKGQPMKKSRIEVSSEAEQLLRDAAAMFSDSRPPANFVVYQDGDMTNHERNESGPPIFDGSVANATPPPLGGATMGASGGAGTILHLACALDVPLALAFFLAMGADARAMHTAFRRLMIHEAACNGSIQCLTLLLELGQKYGATDGEEDVNARMPPTIRRSSGRNMDLPFLPRRMDRGQAFASLQMYAQQSGLFTAKKVVHAKNKQEPKTDFLTMLRLFRECADKVKKGSMTELDAARKVLESATLSDSSTGSLAQTCAFNGIESLVPRSFLRPQGSSSDGHGNTPLHWAAFKNETECVSLLLQFNADPNARAHPSGWTPLHDAAYSNSKESIELLLNAGAQVDARANSGATPLCFAAQEDSAGAAGILLKRGADLSTRCAGGPVRDDGTTVPVGNHPHSRFSGYTPLHYCAHYNAHKAARVLLAHPSSRRAMEIPDLSDRLPIHVAVARGSSDVLRELLHAGARVETRERSDSREESTSRRRRYNSVRQQAGLARSAPTTPTRRAAPSPEQPATPSRSARRSTSSRSAATAVTPVSSPMLRSMIPSQPVSSSKPWNCLSQSAIDECNELISRSEQHWAPENHLLFTPADRQAVMELLRIGKRLEQQGIFVDLWPEILSFCGRGWFEVGDETTTEGSECDDASITEAEALANDGLSLPTF